MASILLIILLVCLSSREAMATTTTWCIARSDASTAALQTALDYACGSGNADCVPIQSSGLCYLPNTLASHASYAFNSYYMRSNAAPGACDFAGTATVSITDPSYGSCTFPSSPSTAGGSTGTPRTNATSTSTPIIMPLAPPPPTFSGIGGGGGGFSPPGIDSDVPDEDSSSVSPLIPLLIYMPLIFLTSFLIAR